MVVNIDVKPRGMASAYVVAPFDEGKEALAKEGYRIISLQENARLRVQEGKDAFISGNGNWTREGVLYVSGRGVYLTRNSPIMTNAQEATQCHRKGVDFYLNPEQVEQGLADSVELKAGAIPVERFGEDKVTVFAFGADAQKYGDFLKEAGINEMPIYVASVGDNAFVRQIWFGFWRQRVGAWWLRQEFGLRRRGAWGTR